MTSLEVFGVNGGDIWDCDCDVTERAPLEDWRLWAKMPTRDLFGDFWMFKGATRALECLSIPSCLKVQSAMVGGGRRGFVGAQRVSQEIGSLISRCSSAGTSLGHLIQVGW